MEINKLIVLVQERPPLWNQKLQQYHMRHVQCKLWDEVGAEMEMPVVDIKKKWKGLRDTFRKELKKCLAEKSEGAYPTKQWPYFTQMEFLSDTMLPEHTQTIIPVSPEVLYEFSQSEGSQIEHDENNEDSEQEKQDEAMKTNSPKKKLFKSPLKRNRKKRQKDAIDEEFVDIERQKFTSFERASNEEKDDDYHFLMSVLPYLRKIPSDLKLHSRMEIMNVVMKYNDCGTPQPSQQ